MKIRIFIIVYMTLLTVAHSYSDSIAQSQRPWGNVTNSAGVTFKIQTNEKTGSPHRIIGMPVNFNKYGNINAQNAQGLSRQFLAEHSDILKITPGNLRFESATTNNGRWYINFQQHYKNVPVYGAYIGFTIHENGTIPLLGSTGHPDISVDIVPTVTAEGALDAANTNFSSLTSDNAGDVRKSPELIVFPVENSAGFDYFLAWNIELEFFGPGSAFSESYFVDAKYGNILDQFSNIRDSEEPDKDSFLNINGNAQIRFSPEGYSGTDNMVNFVEANNGSNLDHKSNKNDMEESATNSFVNINGNVQIKFWPEYSSDPQSTDYFEYGTIEIRNLVNTLVATDVVDESGDYSVTGLAAGFHTVEASLEGPFVKTTNHSIFHSYGAMNGFTHNWTWDASDATNVFYHANVIHDFITSSPFNYSAMNYQMEADVKKGDDDSGDHNGWSDGTKIGFGTFLGRPWPRHSDIIYHEYTHNIIWHLYGNSFIGGATGEAAAMDEGFSDYFSCTITDYNYHGELISQTVRNLDNDWIFVASETRWRNGQVIGGASWDLRQDIGTAITDQLVFEALQMTPHAFNFDDFALNMLIADDNDGNLANSVPHFSNIETAFETNHDILVHIPVFADISGPTSREEDEEGTWTVTASGGVTPYSYAWEYAVDPYSSYSSVGSNSSTLVFSLNEPFELQVTVTDDENFTGIDNFLVAVSGERSKIGTVRLPTEFGLDQNYPNPFNPVTTIMYQLPEASEVTLTVFNTAGQEVAVLIDGQVSAGFHTVQWDASDMASGIYFYQIKAGSFTDMKRMVVIK